MRTTKVRLPVGKVSDILSRGLVGWDFGELTLPRGQWISLEILDSPRAIRDEGHAVRMLKEAMGE